MAMIHAFQSWYYLGGPLLLYAVDKSTRLLNASRMHPIIGIKYHPRAKVTTLCIPSSAIAGRGEFVAGQFCWINIPAIDPFEWHPFSIVSPPFLAQQPSTNGNNGHTKQQQRQQHQQCHQADEDGEESGHIAFAIKVVGNDNYRHHNDDDDNDDDDDDDGGFNDVDDNTSNDNGHGNGNNNGNGNNGNNNDNEDDESQSWTSRLAALARKRERQAVAQAAVRASRGAGNNLGRYAVPASLSP